jgi:TolB protein
MKRLLIPLLLFASGTGAQPAPPIVVAIPPLTSPDSGTRGNEMLAIGWNATQVIAADLGQTAELSPLKPNRDDYYAYPEVTAPTFSKWRSGGAKALVMGFVQSRADGRLTFGCYVYDTDKGRELARKGFVITPGEWRRAAHKCSGVAYAALTGAPGTFDTRIAYVAGTGAGEAGVRRIAVMDSDGQNHRLVTPADSIALSPRFAPHGQQLAYVSFAGGQPNVRIVDLGTLKERPLLASDAVSFSPRYSPDGSRIAFSMMDAGGNSDIYVVDAGGGTPRRLTTSPGIDTSPSFSPDGARIAFESDRSGSQQLYVMNADGTGQRRISFGNVTYAAPDWSPDGQWIAFTQRGPASRRVGVIRPDGSGEAILTSGPADDGAAWAASSRALLFERSEPSGRSALFQVALDGSQPRQVTIPQSGSDPDWSGAMD